MSLNFFVQHHCLGVKGAGRNKIKVRTSKQVVRILPKLSPYPQSARYPEFCKVSLIRYKPWRSSPKEVWGEVEPPTDEDLTTAWQEFFDSPDSQHLIPHRLRRRINKPDQLPLTLGTRVGVGGQHNNSSRGGGLFNNAVQEQDLDGAAESALQREDWQLVAEGTGEGVFDIDDEPLGVEGDIQWNRHHDCHSDETYINDV